jgi:hypothetical protein
MVSPEFKKCGYVLIIASFLSHDKFLRIADSETLPVIVIHSSKARQPKIAR